MNIREGANRGAAAWPRAEGDNPTLYRERQRGGGFGIVRSDARGPKVHPITRSGQLRILKAIGTNNARTGNPRLNHRQPRLTKLNHG